jgi:hypothetical protein
MRFVYCKRTGHMWECSDKGSNDRQKCLLCGIIRAYGLSKGDVSDPSKCVSFLILEFNGLIFNELLPLQGVGCCCIHKIGILYLHDCEERDQWLKFVFALYARFSDFIYFC